MSNTFHNCSKTSLRVIPAQSPACSDPQKITNPNLQTAIPSLLSQANRRVYASCGYILHVERREEDDTTVYAEDGKKSSWGTETNLRDEGILGASEEVTSVTALAWLPASGGSAIVAMTSSSQDIIVVEIALTTGSCQKLHSCALTAAHYFQKHVAANAQDCHTWNSVPTTPTQGGFVHGPIVPCCSLWSVDEEGVQKSDAKHKPSPLLLHLVTCTVQGLIEITTFKFHGIGCTTATTSSDVPLEIELHERRILTMRLRPEAATSSAALDGSGDYDAVVQIEWLPTLVDFTGKMPMLGIMYKSRNTQVDPFATHVWVAQIALSKNTKSVQLDGSTTAAVAIGTLHRGPWGLDRVQLHANNFLPLTFPSLSSIATNGGSFSGRPSSAVTRQQQQTVETKGNETILAIVAGSDENAGESQLMLFGEKGIVAIFNITTAIEGAGRVICAAASPVLRKQNGETTPTTWSIACYDTAGVISVLEATLQKRGGQSNGLASASSGAAVGVLRPNDKRVQAFIAVDGCGYQLCQNDVGREAPERPWLQSKDANRRYKAHSSLNCLSLLHSVEAAVKAVTSDSRILGINALLHLAQTERTLSVHMEYTASISSGGGAVDVPPKVKLVRPLTPLRKESHASGRSGVAVCFNVKQPDLDTAATSNAMPSYLEEDPARAENKQTRLYGMMLDGHCVQFGESLNNPVTVMPPPQPAGRVSVKHLPLRADTMPIGASPIVHLSLQRYSNGVLQEPTTPSTALPIDKISLLSAVLMANGTMDLVSVHEPSASQEVCATINLVDSLRDYFQHVIASDATLTSDDDRMKQLQTLLSTARPISFCPVDYRDDMGSESILDDNAGPFAKWFVVSFHVGYDAAAIVLVKLIVASDFFCTFTQPTTTESVNDSGKPPIHQRHDCPCRAMFQVNDLTVLPGGSPHIVVPPPSSEPAVVVVASHDESTAVMSLRALAISPIESTENDEQRIKNIRKFTDTENSAKWSTTLSLTSPFERCSAMCWLMNPVNSTVFLVLGTTGGRYLTISSASSAESTTVMEVTASPVTHSPTTPGNVATDELLNAPIACFFAVEGASPRTQVFATKLDGSLDSLKPAKPTSGAKMVCVETVRDSVDRCVGSEKTRWVATRDSRGAVKATRMDGVAVTAV